MTKFKIVIEYDGTNYVGWQKQKNGISIQELIENAIFKLSGEKTPVNDGEVADIIIVAANSDNNANHNSLSLYLVDKGDPGLSKSILETIDPTRPACSLSFSNVNAEQIGKKGEGWSMIEDIFNRAAVLFSFEAVLFPFFFCISKVRKSKKK